MRLCAQMKNKPSINRRNCATYCWHQCISRFEMKLKKLAFHLLLHGCCTCCLKSYRIFRPYGVTYWNPMLFQVSPWETTGLWSSKGWRKKMRVYMSAWPKTMRASLKQAPLSQCSVSQKLWDISQLLKIGWVILRAFWPRILFVTFSDTTITIL